MSADVLINGQFHKIESKLSKEYYLSDSGLVHVYHYKKAAWKPACWVRLTVDVHGVKIASRNYSTKDAAMIGC